MIFNNAFHPIFSASFARVIVNFNDETLVPIKHSESLTRNEFFAIAGSLFSLFMGASLLSIIEMLYYIFVRIHSAHRADQGNEVMPIVSWDDEAPEFTFLP